MAYTRYEWECGEVVTAEKLNNIEDGVEEALACCGGSSGYDFIIRKLDSDDPVVISGDFNSVYDKVLNRELIVGYFINSFYYYDAVVIEVFPLFNITNIVADHSLSMIFDKVAYDNNVSANIYEWRVTWDATGITDSEYHVASIT